MEQHGGAANHGQDAQVAQGLEVLVEGNALQVLFRKLRLSVLFDDSYDKGNKDECVSVETQGECQQVGKP